MIRPSRVVTRRVHLRAGGGRVFCGRKLRGLASPTVPLESWPVLGATFVMLHSSPQARALATACKVCRKAAALRERRALALHLPGTDGP